MSKRMQKHTCYGFPGSVARGLCVNLPNEYVCQAREQRDLHGGRDKSNQEKSSQNSRGETLALEAAKDFSLEWNRIHGNLSAKPRAKFLRG